MVVASVRVVGSVIATAAERLARFRSSILYYFLCQLFDCLSFGFDDILFDGENAGTVS